MTLRLGSRLPSGGAVTNGGQVLVVTAVDDVKKGDDVLVNRETGEMKAPGPKNQHGWQRLAGRNGIKAKWLDDVARGGQGRISVPPSRWTGRSRRRVG